MVIPRSRSRSIRSSICSCISRSATVLVICRMRSASVDLPWSMWAMMEKLRIWEKASMRPRIVPQAAKAEGQTHPRGAALEHAHPVDFVVGHVFWEEGDPVTSQDLRGRIRPTAVHHGEAHFLLGEAHLFAKVRDRPIPIRRDPALTSHALTEAEVPPNLDHPLRHW